MTTTTDQTVADIVAEITGDLADVFELMNVAEEEIERAAKLHPDAADTLWHSFSLLRPPPGALMEQVAPFVARGYFRELLERVATGQDTRPGTAAEGCLVLRDVSLSTPLNTPAAGLYHRLWRLAFGSMPEVWQMPGGEHYEALESSLIDEFEAELRRALARRNAWRVPGPITCKGQHHGREVACRYAVAPQPAPPTPAPEPEPADDADDRGQYAFLLADPA
jgi:hypothetical protein